MKTVLILAPIIVGAAALWLAFWLGGLFKEAKLKLASDRISPQLHADLAQFVMSVVNPTSIEDPPYLPGAVREQGLKLVARHREETAGRMRAERRRLGY